MAKTEKSLKASLIKFIDSRQLGSVWPVFLYARDKYTRNVCYQRHCLQLEDIFLINPIEKRNLLWQFFSSIYFKESNLCTTENIDFGLLGLFHRLACHA